MSVRTLLILRGVIALVMAVLAGVAFADGRTFVGILLTAFVVTNVVLIVSITRRRTAFLERFPGLAARRRR